MNITTLMGSLAGKPASSDPTHVGSVQSSFVGARAVHSDVLSIASVTPGIDDYVAVLLIDGISYDLKSEEEQRLLNDLYRVLLCALSLPVQILWRMLPLNVPAYLQPFLQASAGASIVEGVWEQLATSHQAFLQQIAAQRTLLDRHLYLIVRVSGDPSHTAQPWYASLLQSVFADRKKQQRYQNKAVRLESARQELDLRVSELTRLLSNMHLTARRLRGRHE